jgi:hypothetical protein
MPAKKPKKAKDVVEESLEASQADERPTELTDYWDDLKKALKLPRMSDQDLRKFVDDFVSNRIFTSAQLNDSNVNLLPMIFMPLGLGSLSNLQPDSLKQIGCVWEYIDKAGPRSINSMPMFITMNLMHIEDWKRAIPAIEREEKRRASIEL